MKRRDFLQSIAATAATPLLPAGAFASAGGTINQTLYAKAAHWAGLWAHSSAAKIKFALSVDDATAVALFKRLQVDQVITRPDAYGMSKVLVSTYKTPARLLQAKTLMDQTKPAPKAELTKVQKHNSNPIKTRKADTKETVEEIKRIFAEPDPDPSVVETDTQVTS